MRCKNCHTVMMDTDEICVSCHATVASATAGPPALEGPQMNGLWMLLPMFGGALGGLAYGAVAAAHGSNGGSGGTSGGANWTAVKTILAVVLIILGGLFMVLAFVHINTTMQVAQREAKAATPAELRTRTYVSAPPAWVSYTFEESKPIDETVTRHRNSRGGEVEAQCIMVRVETRWMVATVAKGFEGNELVGQIMPIDSPTSQPLIDRVKKQQDDPRSILPYEFYAVEGCPSDQQFRYTVAGMIGGIGFLSFVFGFYLAFAGKRK